MRVESYTQATRAAVEKFLKDKRQAISSEIIRLGGKSRVVNWQSIKLILTDLEREGKVRVSKVGSRVILYEWIGA